MLHLGASLFAYLVNTITYAFFALISFPEYLHIVLSIFESICISSTVFAKSIVSSAYRALFMLCPPIDTHLKSSRERTSISICNEKRSGVRIHLCSMPRFTGTILLSLELTLAADI